MASTDPTIVETSASPTKEVIKGASLPVHDGDYVHVKDIIYLLKSKGYNVKNAVFAYYSPAQSVFIYSGKEGSNDLYRIPLKEIQSRLTLKVRAALPANGATGAASGLTQHPAKVGKKEHSRRNKERKIGEIIEKVSEWRALYTGAPDASGNMVKHSLDEAAKIVGIAKKTLDDYLLQLRAGKKYGFDFQTNKDAKVGVLRAFVKSRKKVEKDGRPSVSDQSGSACFLWVGRSGIKKTWK